MRDLHLRGSDATIADSIVDLAKRIRTLETRVATGSLPPGIWSQVESGEIQFFDRDNNRLDVN